MRSLFIFLSASARERFFENPKKEKGRQLHGGIALLDQVVEGRAPPGELHEVFVSDPVLVRDIGPRDYQIALRAVSGGSSGTKPSKKSLPCISFG